MKVYKKYKLDIVHFVLIIVMLSGMYLLTKGIVYSVDVSNAISLNKYTGNSTELGSYIKGDVLCRTKVLPADFNGNTNTWDYYFFVPYGINGKYILVLTKEKNYKKYKTIPEISAWSEKEITSDKTVKLEGKIVKMASPVYEDFQNMLGLKNEFVDDNGVYTLEKQEQAIGNLITLQVAIEEIDFEWGKHISFIGVTILLGALLFFFLYARRNHIYRWEEEEDNELVVRKRCENKIDTQIEVLYREERYVENRLYNEYKKMKKQIIKNFVIALIIFLCVISATGKMEIFFQMIMFTEIVVFFMHIIRVLLHSGKVYMEEWVSRLRIKSLAYKIEKSQERQLTYLQILKERREKERRTE